ncbi:MAG: hypothetical protein ACXWG1_00905 [Usitatibacter sp.]
MRRSIALTVILSLALVAEANDTGELSLRSKALVAATAPSFTTPRIADAPFTTAHESMPPMLLGDEPVPMLKSSCDATGRVLCYDAADKRIVYRGAREYMPSISGLSPEGVALKRNRIVFRYSFK